MSNLTDFDNDELVWEADISEYGKCGQPGHLACNKCCPPDEDEDEKE